MDYNTSTLCDVFADSVDVVEPMFVSFGGRASYGGEITTIKCFEDKGLVLKTLKQPGLGKILLIDGGGSMRRALIDSSTAQLAFDNGWEKSILVFMPLLLFLLVQMTKRLVKLTWQLTLVA
jgi:regulator of ribonuclease activity A